jgi:exopolyphosphatase/guanosine-5'-triphosphate,3'-diphosphate pyrophosphatase
MKFGAIDIGTNAARLLVGEVCNEEDHHYVKKISYTRIPLRLGDDVFENGKISKLKIKHTTDCLMAFHLIAGIFEVEKLRAVATSAMREAKNAAKVISKVYEKTGIEIEVISGQEEADLIFGTFLLLDFDKLKPFIVIDVGGGSTEISVFENGQKVASKSFEIGTIRLLKEKVESGIWEDISNWIKTNVDLNTEHNLFGTGGNINKVHKIIGLKDNSPVDIKSMEKLLNNLEKLSVEERIDKFHLKPDRADVIVPALTIYLHIMKKINCTEISVPKIGLSDGMIYDMYKNTTSSINI